MTMTATDDEVTAMNDAAAAVMELDADQAERVILWLHQRFGSDPGAITPDGLPGIGGRLVLDGQPLTIVNVRHTDAEGHYTYAFTACPVVEAP
jgi:hypothetical protein